MGEVADKRIPVTAKIWEELSDLKAPGETFAQLLGDMIEREKQRRFFEDMEEILAKDEFVEMQF
jgi:hypothetical protein